MLIMKKINLLLVSLLIGISFALAGGDEQKVEELVSKHKAKIEKADSKDWKIYADCANALVERRIISREVYDWICHSIEIKETIYNRVVKGDYYVLKGEIRKAQAEYVKAIELAKKENKHYEIGRIQWKILISMGVENYNNFHADMK